MQQFSKFSENFTRFSDDFVKIVRIENIKKNKKGASTRLFARTKTI